MCDLKLVAFFPTTTRCHCGVLTCNLTNDRSLLGQVKATDVVALQILNAALVFNSFFDSTL